MGVMWEVLGGVIRRHHDVLLASAADVATRNLKRNSLGPPDLGPTFVFLAIYHTQCM